ncbi:MAG: L-2-amino-thiazoline-4-carboxylic acid hydrolase [Candidatus Odinarchaeota archaeon]
MEIQRFYNFNPDKKQTLNVHGFVETALLALDRYLVYIAGKKPDILDKLVTDLESRYKSAVPSGFGIKDSFNTANVSTGAKKLMDFPSLLTACVDFLLTMLDVPRDYEWQFQEIDLLSLNVTRANQVHFYYRVKSLTELMDREEAIQLLKDYIDFSIANHGQAEQFDDLQSMYESNIKETSEDESGDWIVISIDNGRYISRGDRCSPYEVLKGFNDPELTFITSCYGDFAMVRKMNENFVLTRTHTQLNGLYCDTCIHDTRVVDKIEHPPKEVYENL